MWGGWEWDISHRAVFSCLLYILREGINFHFHHSKFWEGEHWKALYRGIMVYTVYRITQTKSVATRCSDIITPIFLSSVSATRELAQTLSWS
jgi:hypothetical protein